MMRRVAAGMPIADAGSDFGAVVHQRQHAGVHERHEVLGQVAGAITLVGMRGVVPLGGVGDVARLRKTRRQGAVGAPHGEATHVIEVEVTRDHQVDVVDGEAGVGQAVIEVIAPIESVDRRALRVHLVAAPGVDDGGQPVAPHHQGTHAQRNAVPIVGRQLGFPQRARHHAEHGAAVEREEAVAQRHQLEIAERRRRRPAEERHRGRLPRAGAHGGLLQLHQHTLCFRRVDERDQRAFRAGSGFLVDEPDTGGLQLGERGADVVDGQRHVMQAGTSLLEELRDRRRGRGGFEQLDEALASRHEVRLHLLAVDVLDVVDVQAETLTVPGRRRWRIDHRDADVIEPHLHRAPPLPSARPRTSAAAV